MQVAQKVHGLMTSQLRIIRARSILQTFMVPNLIQARVFNLLNYTLSRPQFYRLRTFRQKALPYYRVRKRKWENSLGSYFSMKNKTFWARFGIIGKPWLCTFRIWLPFLNFIITGCTNRAMTEDTPKFAVPNSSLDSIRSPKFGQDACFGGELQLDSRDKCSVVLRMQNLG